MRMFKRCAPSSCGVLHAPLRLALLHRPSGCSRCLTNNASPDRRETRLAPRSALERCCLRELRNGFPSPAPACSASYMQLSPFSNCKISDRAWRPEQYKAQQRHHFDCRRFLWLQFRFMVGCTGAASGAPVFLYAGSSILRNPPPYSAWRQNVAAPQYKKPHR